MNKQEAKSKISQLVTKYQRVVDEGRIKSYNEAQTRNEFIEPLFEYLGWDMRNLANDHEVTTEESISRGRVDLAFRMNGIPTLFLEAKALKVDLNDWKFAEQAINYSWNKGVTWAVLTDFESVKIFNAEIPPKSISQNLFIEIHCNEFTEKFDQLWLLSKESFENNLLSKEAERWGKLTKRKQVGEMLFDDLMKWRLNLVKNIKKSNELEEEVINEGVQRILDRLLFIRTAEDRQIEPGILQSIARSGKNNYYKQLSRSFRNFDDGFNSKLFAYHYCEEWKIDDKVISEIINGLYETSDGYRYDFSVISADVLGGIYEQYLSYVQGRKSKIKTKSKRKAQGIYYTPEYIVDYIVKETLGEVLKKTKKKNISKIKILDPACGSGSFLISAYDKLMENIDVQSLFAKHDILEDNIYGIDLDAQAIEIAQLNLLLKVLSQRTKLPSLQHKLKVGNSLISNGDVRFKPFDFKSEFHDVFLHGGFDVIIGNPPYIRADIEDENLQLQRKEIMKSKEYKTLYEKWDIYIAFIEKSLSMLKKGGYLGFIISNAICTSKYAFKLLELIRKKYNVVSINYFERFKVFKRVGVVPIILIIKNQKQTTGINKIIRRDLFDNIVSNTTIKKDEYLKIGLNAFKKDYIDCSSNVDSIFLGEICYISKGMVINADEKTSQGEFVKNDLISVLKTKVNNRPYVEGKNIDSYNVKLIRYLEWGTKRVPDKISRATFTELYNRPKIMRGRVTGGICDKTGLVCNDSIILMVRFTDLQSVKNKSIQTSIKKYTTHSREELETISSIFELEYILAIINSSYAFKYLNSIRRHRLENYFYPDDFRKLPIPKASKKIQNEFVTKVKMLSDLYTDLHQTDLNTDKYSLTAAKISKITCEIDSGVNNIFKVLVKEHC